MRVICSLYLPARYLLCPQRIVSSNLSYSSNIARLRLSFSVLVHRRIQTIQLGGDLAGGFGPDEGRGSVVVLGDVAVDGLLQLDDRAEDAAPEPAPDPIRGPARMPLQPGQHLGVLVRAVVVEDGMDELAGRDRRLDGVEEAQELLVAV